ncbi:MAG: MBL fold metallo-hydrolase [Treponema sp.]|nr:MBL fold metallo-hydrolase [Treponema sp.]
MKYPLLSVVGPVSTNCWIYPYADGCAAIIDPGDEADVIISALKNINSGPLKPEYILLTHGHFDHICAVPQLKNVFKDDVKIAIHSLDANYLGPDAYNTHKQSMKAAMGDASILDYYWNAFPGMPSADIILEEGSTIGPFTALHIPGHTPGSMAFWDRENGVLFTGDTLFQRGYGRTDLPGGNEKQICESLRRLFAMESSIKVYPGHGDATTIEQESKGIQV